MFLRLLWMHLWENNMKLDEYQLEAIEKLKTGSVLCGGTGSGKSRTALGYFFYKVCGEDPDVPGLMMEERQLVIITTAKKRDEHEWDNECTLFDIEDYIVDSWNNITKYIYIEDAFFIFDEQRVVGKGTWVKSFLKIAKHNDWILLSATPGDKYEDYVPLFIANGFYRNRTEFNREHIVYKWGMQKYPIIDHYVGCGKLDCYIRDIIVKLPYINTREHIYVNVLCDYDKDAYRKLMKEQWNYDEDRPIETASELCYAIRKLVNSDSSRVFNLLTLFNEHPKAIIFYSFNYELELIEAALTNANIPYTQWNGHKHEHVLSGDKWAYLVQYTAGCEGWECTTTDTIIFYSLQYSYKVSCQAAGRIDRRNTPFNILYYYTLHSRAIIDLRIREAINNKEDFNERTIYS